MNASHYDNHHVDKRVTDRVQVKLEHHDIQVDSKIASSDFLPGYNSSGKSALRVLEVIILSFPLV